MPAEPPAPATPPKAPFSAELSPVPKTMRKSKGWASEATSRKRSRQYRITSRYQMM